MRSQTRVLRWGRIDDEAMDYCILYMDCHRRIGGVDRSQCKLRAVLLRLCFSTVLMIRSGIGRPISPDSPSVRGAQRAVYTLHKAGRTKSEVMHLSLSPCLR